jgi:hypothetical protein
MQGQKRETKILNKRVGANKGDEKGTGNKLPQKAKLGDITKNEVA